MSFTCPECDRTSFHPEDERHHYCGACHKFFDPETGWPCDTESVISDQGFVKLDILATGSLVRQAHAEAYARQHLQMLQIKEQYPEEYEAALEALRCMYAQKSSGPHESWRAKLRRAWRRFARAT
jgi:hypothetical protein